MCNADLSETDVHSDEYFGKKRGEYEMDALDRWQKKRKIGQEGCSFGFQPFKDELEQTLKKTLERNASRIFLWLQTTLTKAMEAAETTMRTFNVEGIATEIAFYVQLNAAALQGVATRYDIRRAVDDFLSQLERDYPGQVLMSESALAEAITKKTMRTFEEEKADMLSRGIPEDTLLLSPELELFLKNAGNLIPGTLQDDSMRLGGGAAVRRVLQRLGLANMVCKLKDFTIDEIEDKMGSQFQYSKVVGADWDLVLRSMVEDMLPNQRDMDVICKWVERIYSSQVAGVREVLGKGVGLLKSHSRLRDFVDDCIEHQYTKSLENLRERSIERITHICKQGLKQLSFDNIIHEQVHILIALGQLYKTGMFVQHATDPENAYHPLLTARLLPHFRSVIDEDITGSGIKEEDERKLVFSLVKETGFEPSVGVDAGQTENVASRADKLNVVAQAMARYRMGKAFESSKTVIYELFEDKVHQISKDIPAALESIARLLLSSQHKALLDHLVIGDSMQVMEEMRSSATKLEELMQDTEAMLAEMAGPEFRTDQSNLRACLQSAKRVSSRLKQALEERQLQQREAEVAADGESEAAMEAASDPEQLKSHFLLALEQEQQGKFAGKEKAEDELKNLKKSKEDLGLKVQRLTIKTQDLSRQLEHQLGKEQEIKETAAELRQEWEAQTAAKLQAKDQELKDQVRAGLQAKDQELKDREAQFRRELQEKNKELEDLEAQFRRELQAKDQELKAQLRTELQAQEQMRAKDQELAQTAAKLQEKEQELKDREAQLRREEQKLKSERSQKRLQDAMVERSSSGSLSARTPSTQEPVMVSRELLLVDNQH